MKRDALICACASLLLTLVLNYGGYQRMSVLPMLVALFSGTLALWAMAGISIFCSKRQNVLRNWLITLCVLAGLMAYGDASRAAEPVRPVVPPPDVAHLQGNGDDFGTRYASALAAVDLVQGQRAREDGARQYAARTGKPFAVCLRAIEVWEWCLAHPHGGAVDGKLLSEAVTEQQLAQAMRVLNLSR